MRRILCLTAAVAFVGVGRADDKAVPFSDPDFVNMAASGGLMEVELGKLAAAHGGSAEVKKFGQRMVDDHTKANAELKRVAAAGGFEVPAKMMDKHQKHFDMLKGLTGAEFDRAYVKHMVKDHEEDVALFTQASAQAKTPALKEFAAKTLPTLKEHLELAKKLHSEK